MKHITNTDVDFLREVLANAPVIPLREKTFFDISKFPRRENVISNWYAYFLNSEEEHGLGDLFLKVLLKVLSGKRRKEFELTQFFIRREVVTPKGKRIDIVLYGTGLDAGKQIIIENKISHYLNNDLLEYWDHQGGLDSNKVGIVLSLKKELIKSELQNKYYNIQHREIVKDVKDEVDTRDLNQKQQFYLNEFLNAMDNLSKDIQMDNSVAYYFENAALLCKAIQFQNNAKRFLINQIRIAADELNLEFTKEMDRYCWLNKKDEVCAHYTIIFEKLISGKGEIDIIIELNNEGISKMKFFDEKLVQMINAAGLQHVTLNKAPYFVHYATKHYHIEVNDLEKLSDILVYEIKTHFEPLLNEITLVLNEN